RAAPTGSPVRPAARASTAIPTSRCCGNGLTHTVLDLGMSPRCESFLSRDQLNQMEPFYPLHVWVCSQCFLVQVEEFVRHDQIFDEYAYLSSYSESWLSHARRYVDGIVERLGLYERSRVVELGNNDGYLLQW